MAGLVPAPILALALLLLFVLAGADSLRRDSATFDETAHLPAGRTYLERRDFRLNAEHPPLAKAWAALPVLVLGRAQPDYGSAAWTGRSVGPAGRRSKADEWIFGYETLNGPIGEVTRRDPMRALVPARLAMLVPAAVLGWIVFLWSRELWGAGGALVSTLLFSLSPTMLAHARLVTTDLPAALGIVAALWTFWRFTRRPTWARALGCAASVALALSTKFSALLLAPMLALGALLWVARRESASGDRRCRGRWLAVVVPVVVAAAWAGLWCVYGLRFSAAADPGYALDWEIVGKGHGLASSAVRLALGWKLLPEAWLYGLAYFLGGAARRASFLNGDVSLVGWWYYFPEAFALKTPPALLLLAGWWLARTLRDRAWRAFDVVYPAAAIAVYVGVSIQAHLNIGHRHLAPVEPLLFVLVGGLWTSVGASRARRALLVTLLAGYAVSFAVATPRYLSYFNLLAGGPRGGWRFLLDSNVDWGQDLLRLREWMERGGIREIHLAYFGTADPSACGIVYRKILLVHDFDPSRPVEPPGAGDRVAVSANLLQGLYHDEDADLALALLRTRRVPPARIDEWIRLRNDLSARGERHPALADWLLARGVLTSRDVAAARTGLLSTWLRHIRDDLEPEARIGDSIFVYRLP